MSFMNLLDRIHFSTGWSIEVYTYKDKRFNEDRYAVLIYGVRGGYRDRFNLRAEDITKLTSKLSNLTAATSDDTPCENCALSNGCVVQPFTEECKKLRAVWLVDRDGAAGGEET